MSSPHLNPEQRRAFEVQLLSSLRERKVELEALLSDCNSHWSYEDPIYRFYHQSFKVYFLQESTNEIVSALKSLLPDRLLNSWFQTIISEGTGKTFEMSDNEHWLESTRPILEAFFHARFFLEMACSYAEAFTEPPEMLPSGWAGLLYLYDLR